MCPGSSDTAYQTQPTLPLKEDPEPAPPGFELVQLWCPTRGAAARSWRLAARMTLGRSQRADVRAVDRAVSGIHCEVRLDGEAVTVEDLESSNGTRVGGRPIPPGTPTPLPVGAILRVGGSFFLVRHLWSRPTATVQDLMLVSGPGAADVLTQLAAAVRQNQHVLLVGETGVGKEHFAEVYAALYGRELFKKNAGAILSTTATSELHGHVRGAFTGADRPHRGMMMEANKNALFLDEIGATPPEAQVALLRALENQEVTPVGATRPTAIDVRVVAATNEPVHEYAALKRFRPDLLARFGTPVAIPPLRDRRDEILPLLFRFTKVPIPLSADLVERILTADWPQNIRQLGHFAAAVKDTARDADEVALTNLPPAAFEQLDARHTVPTRSPATPETAAAPERPAGRWPDDKLRAAIERALEAEHGNISRAARALGRNRSTLYAWMKRLGIPATDKPLP